MQCKKCGSDNTQRLEVIYEQGTSNITSTSYTAGGGYAGILGLGGATTKTSGIQQTGLGLRAAPPAKRSYRWAALIMFIGFCFSGSSILIGGTLMAIATFFIHRAFQFNSNAWPQLYKYWQECWLCNKCGEQYHDAQDQNGVA